MGPVSLIDKSLPSRPKFSWDGKSVPWTDGHGPQDKYAEAVEDWSSFHDLLPDTNPNKFPKNVRGTILKSQLYGRARDLVRCVTTDELQPTNGASFVVDAIFKRDPLTVLADVYADFNNLVNALRGSNESFRNYEMRFNALVSEFKSHGSSISFPESITAFVLMASATIDDNHRVSILAVAANDISAEADLKPSSRHSSADLVKNVRYQTFASILRQCEKRDIHEPSNNSLSFNQCKLDRGKRPARINSDRLSRMKNRYPCRRCGKYGHWRNDHGEDGSLKPGAVRTDHPSDSASNGRKSTTSGSDGYSNQPSKPSIAMGFTSVMRRSFLVANVTDPAIANFRKCGPLVDDGAPFSAIGEMELHTIEKELTYPPTIGPKPDHLSAYDTWQYGSGAHASQPKPIPGSVEILVRTDAGLYVSIRRLVIKGFSGWVIGRSITRSCTIEHIRFNALILPGQSGDLISLVDVGFHSYLPFDRFQGLKSQESPSLSCLSAASSAVEVNTLDNWAKLRRVVDRVHKHTCGHASYSDMRTLLTRNALWNDQVQSYLASLVRDCSDCKASSTPPPNRRVSISSLDRSFNDVVRVDHFFLEGVTLFHIMDVATRFSAAHVVTTTNIEEAIYAFELVWISQFWPPVAIRGDGAFQTDAFKYLLDQYDIMLRPIPPRRHSKNMIEPRHGVIRSIFLRLRHANPEQSVSILAVQAARISNDLYGNDVVSSFELAKGFT